MRKDDKPGRLGWPSRSAKNAANLLEALEALRMELGSVGEDIITIMRDAGVTPPDEPAPGEGNPGEA